GEVARAQAPGRRDGPRGGRAAGRGGRRRRPGPRAAPANRARLARAAQADDRRERRSGAGRHRRAVPRVPQRRDGLAQRPVAPPPRRVRAGLARPLDTPAMSTPHAVAVGVLLETYEGAPGLAVEILAGRNGLHRPIRSPHVQKTGLALAGFHEYIRP